MQYATIILRCRVRCGEIAQIQLSPHLAVRPWKRYIPASVPALPMPDGIVWSLLTAEPVCTRKSSVLVARDTF